MKFWNIGAATSVVAIAAATLTPAAYAQQTTSEIRGTVTDVAGAPISGVSVTIIDTRTEASRLVTTNENGDFAARSLTVGGPYSVAVSGPSLQPERIDGIEVSLGSATVLTFDLEAGAPAADVIVVTATRANSAQLAVGPNASYNLETLESFPSVSRDIRDIIRFDPRVSLDRDNEVDRISCLGGNDRSNTFTVDGVVQADTFGLNGTPFAARNTLPLPFDSISQTVVEFSPFDVEYGQFTGCNINVVTKSGTNDFHGSAFFNYAGSGLQGTKIRGESFEIEPYDDFNWGATIGGPILKDRLFFFAAYEETDDADVQERGPQGGGFPNELDSLTVDQANEISNVLSSVYGIDTGGIARSLPQTSRRILTRGDWYINDAHRLEFTYQRLRESNVEEDDFGFPDFAFFNNFENEGTESQTYSARFFSQWTDNLSTELRASRADIKDIQAPVGGGEALDDNPIPRIIVGVQNDGILGAANAGPGLFRSTNDLNTQIDQVKAKFDFIQGNHTFTGGYELNQLDVFNIFITDGTGTLTFQDVDALREGRLNTGARGPFGLNDGDLINNQTAGATGTFAFSGNPEDVAAVFSRSIHSVYFQDEWTPIDPLTVIMGLRYDWYEGDDTPLENQNFIARYGFTNANDFNDLNAFLPRVGFTYDSPFNFFGDTEFRGGVGVFTGGDPTVWFGNAYANSGNLIGSGSTASANCAPEEFDVVDDNGVFTGVPQCIIDAGVTQAQTSAADTQSTDPELKLATVIRSNLGFTTITDFGGPSFFNDWRVDIDFIHSRFRNPYNFVDLSQTPNPDLGLNGFMVDGRPIYRAIDPTNDGCNATLIGTGGTPPRYQNVSASCFATGRDDEIQLTNSDGYSAYTISAILAKTFDFAVTSNPGSVAVSLGYAYTNADNRRDATSSLSTGNFDDSSLFDRQNPTVSTASFETRHNVSIALNVEQEFVRDYPTRLGLFFGARSGRPFSYTFDGSGDFNDFSSGSDNASLYVPTGVNDPFISPDSDATAVASLDQFIAEDSCLSQFRGQTAPRNSCRNDWVLDMDMRFQQSLPMPGDFFEDRLTLFVDVDNLLNLIDSSANIFERKSSENNDLTDVAFDDQGRYVITGFNPDDDERVTTSSSVWALQFGLRYEF